jgi:hypothetical protein
VLTPIAREVTVVTVDHRQARAHVTGEVEGRDAGTQGKGGEGVPQIVDPAERLDPGRQLGWFPESGSEVMQIEVAAARRGKDQRRARIRWCSFKRGERGRLEGTARTLASVLGHLSRPLVKARRM